MYLIKKKALYSALVLILGMTLISNVSFAQQKDDSTATLSGKVVKASSNEVVSGVDVQLKELDKKATTNQQGMFSFEDLKPGTYTVVVEADGYKAWKKEIKLSSEGKTLDIKLKPSSMGE